MADAADTNAPVAIFKKRANNKSNLRKRAATPPPASSSDSDSDGYSSADNENGPKAKRPRKTGAGVMSVSTADGSKPAGDIVDIFGVTKFSADRSSYIAPSDDATRQSNWFEEKELLGTTRSMKEPVKASALSLGTAKKPPGTMGPVKAPTNIRMVTVTDFAPDVCKDYKQTGFCGFGDNCKFLHARENYAQGWALDKEWELKTKGQKKLKGTIIASASNRNGVKEPVEDEAEAKELENIPFKCIICKDDYKDPIVTRCGHYFCERCALDKYKKGPSCAACGQGTNGVFNGARNLKKLLSKKKAREERIQKEKEEEEAEDED
jgi:RING finger protein 113A